MLLLLGLVLGLQPDPMHPLSRIAFGSCYGQFGVHNDQVWQAIRRQQADLFIWSGDVAYTDVFIPFYSRYATREEWQYKLNTTKADPGYTSLRAESMIIGTWDDHDSGLDDGDKTNPHLTLAKELFLEFIDEPLESTRRKHAGIQASYIFGTGNRTVKVILLDVRTFRDPWTYTEWNYEGDSLGVEQWEWLERELSAPGAVTIVVSGTVYAGLQVFVEDKYGVVDRWHPASAARLAALLSPIPGAFVISGDVHQAEMIHFPCSEAVVREVTSSGLSHSVVSQWGILGVLYNYLLIPLSWNASPRHLVKNFGTIDIAWENDPLVTISLRNDNGEVLFRESFRISESLQNPQFSSLCQISAKERFLRHITGTLLLILPVALWTAAGVIYLRKHSHSY